MRSLVKIIARHILSSAVKTVFYLNHLGHCEALSNCEVLFCLWIIIDTLATEDDIAICFTNLMGFLTLFCWVLGPLYWP